MLHTAADGRITTKKLHIRAATAAVPIEGGSATATSHTAEPGGPRRHQLRDGRPTTGPIEAEGAVEPRPPWRNVSHVLPRLPVPLPRAVTAPVATEVPVDATSKGARAAQRQRKGAGQPIAETSVTPPVPVGVRRRVRRARFTTISHHERLGPPKSAS